MSKSPSAIIKMRIFAACAVALLGFAVLIGRLFYIQIIETEEYQRQAAETQLEVTEIAANRGMSEANVKVILHRARGKLKLFLEKEGIIV